MFNKKIHFKMMTFSFRRSKLNVTVFCVAAVVLSYGSILLAQPLKVFAVSDMMQVFEDGYKMPVSYDTVKLFGIRGEIISSQFVINATKSVMNITVEITPLKNLVKNKMLPNENIEWNFVGSVPLSKNTPNQPVSAVVRPAPANFPDYLMAEKQISMKEKTFKSVWLTIRIPETAEAVSYEGKVIVKSPQGDISLPLFVKVFPLTLPTERHLKVVEWCSTDKFAKLYGITEEYTKPWFDMLKIYAENMVSHRQNVFRVPMEAIEILKSKTNSLEFDFKRFDQIAQVFWSTGKMDCFETGFLTKFGKGDWFSTEILLKDFSAKDIETGAKITLRGEDVIPYLLQALEIHLREKGWLDKTFFHIKDEPSIHNALAWKTMSEYMHKYAPDIRRIDAIETTFLLDDIEVAVPKLDALAAWYPSYKAWQEKGNELWFYTVGIYQGSLLPNKTIDMPVMNSRIMHWLNYRYNITGYLHWGYNQWTDDPFTDPDIHIGDGWHVYPSKDGVLNSIRWEQMRNGIQDYEYFWLLESRIKSLRDSLGSGFSWIDPKQRGQEIAANVVLDFVEHTYDPAVLNKAKMQLINELIGFDKSPRMYVQTIPKVNSTLTTNSSVEVYGWAEPGTRITINGKELPVSNQGLFLELFQLSSDRKLIKVQATNSFGTKEAVREFIIK
jgi:hypothetical protein